VLWVFFAAAGHQFRKVQNSKRNPASAVAPKATANLQAYCNLTCDARPGNGLTQLRQQSLNHVIVSRSREKIALDLFKAESARTKNPLGGEFCFWPKILKVKYATL
jgi:hypothetical protein